MVWWEHFVCVWIVLLGLILHLVLLVHLHLLIWIEIDGLEVCVVALLIDLLLAIWHLDVYLLPDLALDLLVFFAANLAADTLNDNWRHPAVDIDHSDFVLGVLEY